MSKVLIVGGGAAGMFASIFAAKNGNEVHVFEKNEKLGKKLCHALSSDAILQFLRIYQPGCDGFL